MSSILAVDDAALLEADRLARETAIRVDLSVLCTAPAGSGKTELLVQRTLACLATVKAPESVVPITFTNKAAAEIRERVLRALQLASGPEPEQEHAQLTWKLGRAVLKRDQELGWGLTLNPSRIRAMTIDALNSFLAGQAPVSSGMGGGIGVADRPQRIYRDAIQSLFAEMDDLPPGDSVRDSLAAVLRYGKNRFEDLVPILSGMLSRRDQWLSLVARAGGPMPLPDLIGPIILSRMEQLVARVDADLLDDVAGAAAGAGVVEEGGWPEIEIDLLPRWQKLCAVLLTKSGDVRKRLTSAEGFPADAAYSKTMKSILATLHEMRDVEEIGDALAGIAALPSVEDARAVEVFSLQVRTVLLRLAAHLRLAFVRAGALDFQEVAARALGALSDDVGATPLLQRLDYIIEHILVDESQDTSKGQVELLRKLTEGWTPGDGRSVFIVGDCKQSIYGFRQADVGLLLGMMEKGEFNAIPLTCVNLTRNFRSDSKVVEWCNRIFSRIFPSADDRYSGGVRYMPSVSAKGDTGGEVVTHWFRGDPEQEEAARVVEIARAAQMADPCGSIAILCRYRSHVRQIIAALKKAELVFTCKDIDPLAETPAVKDVVSLIRALWHEQDRVSWAALLRAPFVGLSYQDLLAVTIGRTKGSLLESVRQRVDASEVSAEGRERLRRFLGHFDAISDDRDLAAHLAQRAEALWHALGGAACVSHDEAEDIRSVFALLRQQVIGGRLEDIRDFLESLDKLYAGGGAGGVQVMTAHASKGLEFGTVILAGLWRGQKAPDRPLLTYRRTETGTLVVPAGGALATEGHVRLYNLVHRLNVDADKRELVRLLYVACTRAVKRLHLIAAVSDKGSAKSGSMLHALWPALASDFAAAEPAATMRNQTAVGHACPTTPRLPVSWRPPMLTDSYVPAITRVLQPSEMVVREEGRRPDENLGVFDRLVGTLYHESIERLLKRNEVAQFSAVWDKMASSIRYGMQRRGMPAPKVEEAVERIRLLVGKTIESEDGRWILQRRPMEGIEYRTGACLRGDWVNSVIDRWFVDEGDLWVVDYKTGGFDLTGEDLDRFVAQEAEGYRPQLESYGEVMGLIVGQKARLGVYFPAAGRLVRL